MTQQKRSLADLINAFETKNNDAAVENADWKKFFPFYKADADTTTTARFLPDLDEDNPRGFVVENLYHELTINGRKERVACLQQHGEECPACRESQRFYDEKSPLHDPAKGKALYRKKSYIAQAVILDTPVQMREDAPLVWLLDFGPQIYNKILADMKSGDLENSPIEFKGGHNFRIRKTKNGNENSYSTSSFSPKSTDLPDDVIDRVLDGMYDLKEFRAKKIDKDVMETMVQAALHSLGAAPAPAPAPAPRPAAQPAQTPVSQQLGTDLGADSPDVGAEPAPAPAPAPAQSARDLIKARAAALRNQRQE